MQHPAKSLLLSTLILAGCAPDAAGLSVSAQQESAPSMLDLQIGDTLPGFERLATESAPGGDVIVDVPMPAGPLSEIFHDYSVQVDPNNRKVVAASAKRTFPSFAECQARFDTVAAILMSKYRFDSQSTDGPASLEASIGPVSVESMCLLHSGSDYPTLSVTLFNKSLAVQAYERARQRDGR